MPILAFIYELAVIVPMIVWVLITVGIPTLFLGLLMALSRAAHSNEPVVIGRYSWVKWAAGWSFAACAFLLVA